VLRAISGPRRRRRRGGRGLDTTRGDRLFISPLGSAFIHLAWLGFVGPSLWRALVISAVFVVAVFRWV
jgi:predicted small integral membrane protein